MEIKGLQQWYGKFDQIEFDLNILEGEFAEPSIVRKQLYVLVCLSNAGSLLLKISEYSEYELLATKDIPCSSLVVLCMKCPMFIPSFYVGLVSVGLHRFCFSSDRCI